MTFIENAWAVIVRSYSVWLSWLFGALSAYLTFLLSLTPADQVTLHAAVQLHWIPIGMTFLGIFGGPFARAKTQQSVTNASQGGKTP